MICRFSVKRHCQTVIIELYLQMLSLKLYVVALQAKLCLKPTAYSGKYFF